MSQSVRGQGDGQWRCGDPLPERAPTDIAGRLNDLINAYLCTARALVPYVVVGLIALVLLILAGHELIKG
jgi:hypothetical protein